MYFTVVAIAVAILAYIGNNWHSIRSRIVFGSQAINTLVSLDQSDYDNFINSYDVFDDPQHTEQDEIKVNAVYKLLVPLMELGALTKFYIPPLMDPNRNSFFDMSWNQQLFEHKMSDLMKLDSEKVALDIGCGQGLIADTVQEFSGAKVVGINISPEQLSKAKNNAQNKDKLGSVLDFQYGSMNDKLPFPDNSFDSAYIVQANVYAHNYTHLMSEVKRILKPKGIFSDLAIGKCSVSVVV